MTPPLAGKSVVITGSSRGIGAGLARAFHEQGATLHLVALDDGVHAVAAELDATSAKADIAIESDVARAIAPLRRIDVLINNAGLELMTPLDGSTQSRRDFRRIVKINVIGTMLVTTEALSLMPAGSSIVNTASIWGRVAESRFGAYVASKHAVIGLTKTWAKELGPRGIRVNAVCPGWVRTEASMRSLEKMAQDTGAPQEELLDAIVGGQALPGLMEPADVAGPYLFLASELAKNVTGQTLGVDRGEVPW